ncbi:MAG: Cas8a1 family CRISPR/Cas system-associated protein [candidate division WOR-3 bacterium]|nr:Cas8a1 family CRISPR/Cas system-associated protein [candidate division WOR-3 bacterium]
MDNAQITLYPSNWLYNAGVIGFLKVLEEVKKLEEYKNKIAISFDEEFIEIKLEGLHIQNKNDLENIIFKKWNEITSQKLGISYEGKTGGTQNFYYSNQTEKSIRNRIKLLLQIENIQIENKRRKFWLSCSFCGSISSTTKSKLRMLNQSFGNILLGSERTFPNTYWMLKSKEFVCPKCEFILMCHHIPFVFLKENKTDKIEIFINAPNFRLIWDLNKFTENIIKYKEYEVRKLLGLSLLEWAIKRRALLGAWTMMNIEVIIKKENTIDYFDLPYHITKILLNYEIADLINQIGEEKIFDLILAGKFSELEKANYYVLRTILKLKNNEEISDNDPITKYFDNYNNLYNLQKVSKILPQLYGKIIKSLEKKEV